MPKWTDAQQAAIQADSRDILVSAAAGSGKTTVMIERIMALLRKGATLERMLIVTFTRAAAGEMRDRLTAALEKEMEASAHLRAEYDRLGQAHISTLHTFCSTVLRRHFQEAGTDPLSRVADESITATLWDRALDEALDDFYLDPNEDAQALIDQFPEENIASLAKDLYRFLMSQADPWGWLDSVLTTPDADGLRRHPMYQVMKDAAMLKLEGALQYATACEAIALAPDGPARYLDNNAQDKAAVLELIKSLETSDFLPGAHAYTPSPLSRKKAPPEENPERKEEFQELRKKIKACVADVAKLIPASEEQLTLWAQGMARTLPAQRGLAALTRDVHQRYQAHKAHRALWDYNDLEHQTLQALSNPEVARDMSGQFDSLFVDEYQDISRTQEAIIASIHLGNDLFMVGDVKQSIYRFRLADPTLFLSKYLRFEEGPKAPERIILLSENFRSRPNILEAVNEVFDNTMRSRVTEIDYDSKAQLNPGREGERGPEVELHIITREASDLPEEKDDASPEEDNSEEETADISESEELSRPAQFEAAVIARRIHALAGTPGGEGTLQYRDMVILLRSAASHGDIMASVLNDAGIPVYNDADMQYYEMPEINDILNILKVLDNPLDDVRLLSALSCPCFDFGPLGLAYIRKQAQDRRLPFWQAFDSLKDDPAVEEAHDRLARWRFLSRHMPFDLFMRFLVEDTGLYARSGALPGGEQRRANLRLLCEKAKGSPIPWTLDTFLSHVDSAKAANKESAMALGENDNAVRIMTIHKSKGLEFPLVFLAGLGKSFRFDDKGDQLALDAQAGFALPYVDVKKRVLSRTYAQRAMKEKKKRETRSEEARLLYVAMTRAKERLILLGTPRSMKSARAFWQTPAGDYAAGTASSMLDWVGNSLWEGLKDGLDRAYTGHRGAVWQLHWHPADTLTAPLSQPEAAFHPPAYKAPQEELLRMMRPLDMGGGLLKTSVTALIKQSAQQDEEETPDIKRQALAREMPPMPRPQLGDSQALSAADRGSIAHKALSVLDLDSLRRLDGAALRARIEEQADRMAKQGLLLQKERDSLETGMLTRFLESPLGQRLLQSGTIRREWAFTLKAEDVLLQGVLDCCFLEENGWVLLDHKTDWDTAAILPRYRDQMRWYMRALRALTDQPIQEAWLYALKTGEAFPVTEEEEIRLDKPE